MILTSVHQVSRAKEFVFTKHTKVQHYRLLDAFVLTSTHSPVRAQFDP